MQAIPENKFSEKKYFINNLDSYHGEYIVNQVAKILEQRTATETKPTSETVLGEDAPYIPPQPAEPYEILGTLADPNVKKMDNVSRIVAKEKCFLEMLASGTVVLDISCDNNELTRAKDYLKLLKDLLEKENLLHPNEAGDTNIKKRHLILISTVMTWACTKPLDPETPDLPFVETDFRKRKPHPNYKMHFDIENDVIALARGHKHQIGAVVVSVGATYGGKEDVLYHWFQKAWECEPLLPILGRGTNFIPLLNVADLAQIIYNLLSDFPKKLYILAVEQNPTRQREIIKPLGRQCGSGLFKCILQEDAFLIADINQRIADLMTLNLILEPTFIVETMGLQWTSELTFAENVPTLMKQFTQERALKPFKILIYGPPIVGKTTVSKAVCESYGLIYVSPETVAQDLTRELEFRIRHWEMGELIALDMLDNEEKPIDDDEDTGAGEEEAMQEATKSTYAILTSGRPLAEEEILGFLRQKLLTREAQNRGWVLDGFPTNLTQCSTLFEKGEEIDTDVDDEGEDRFEEDVNLYDHVTRKLLPDIVVCLDATDDFICAKAMCQPEGDPRLDEEVLLKRLLEFRSGDTRDLSPLNFFDELDIHPLVVPVNEHDDYEMKRPYADVTLRMGRPCRYPKLMDIIEAAEKREKKELETLRSKEEKIQKELELKMQQEREDKMEYWSELYAMLREEEEAALAAAGEPMRNYLMNHIFPTLTPALLEVAKLRPDDPVDFLAEHLFKLNPTGKMLEPGYNLMAEKLLGKIKILDDSLQELDIKIDSLIPHEAEFGEPSDKK